MKANGFRTCGSWVGAFGNLGGGDTWPRLLCPVTDRSHIWHSLGDGCVIGFTESCRTGNAYFRCFGGGFGDSFLGPPARSVEPAIPPAPARTGRALPPRGVVSGQGTRGRHTKKGWAPNTRPARRKTGFPEPKIVKIQGFELAGNATGPDHVPAFPHRQTGLEASSKCTVVRKK